MSFLELILMPRFIVLVSPNRQSNYMISTTHPLILLEANWIDEGDCGFSDIVLSSEGPARLFASGLDQAIYVWDLRMGNNPSLKMVRREIFFDKLENFNSIEIDSEEQIIYGVTEFGYLISWDIRGASQSPEVQYLKCETLAKLLEGLGPNWFDDDTNPTYEEYYNTFTTNIHSIRRDPSCPNQLAIHFGGGGSGVYNIQTEKITHLHCPLLNSREHTIPEQYLRRPSWMPTNSVYSVATGNKGVYLVNFAPRKASKEPTFLTNETFIRTTDFPISCVVHPNTGTIIAGTPQRTNISYK